MKVEQIKNAPMASASAIKELLDTSLPAFERDLRDIPKNSETMPEALQAYVASLPTPPPPTARPFDAIIAGAQKYTNIPVPILAIFAVLSYFGLGPMAPSDPAVRAAFLENLKAGVEAQAKAIERGVPFCACRPHSKRPSLRFPVQ